MQKLFTEFSPIDADTWKKKIESDLKGIEFDSLIKQNRNGIKIKPFYSAADIAGKESIVPPASSWDICTNIFVTNEADANKLALEDLQNGASALKFIINSKLDVAKLLKDISIQHIYLQFEVNNQIDEFLFELNAYLISQKLNWADLNVSVVNDELSYLVQHNSFRMDEAAFKNNFLNVLKASNNKAFSVDATIYNNAGSNSVSELASTVAQVNEYLNLLAEQNKLSEIAQLTINVAVDTNFFEQIAKLRALRNLVNLLLEQYNSNATLHLHVETSDVYRSAFDSYSNLLRDSISGMAAVIGNCESLSIHHFNNKSEDSKLATRMSRNQQLIFKEESYLDKVNDISNGSYYIETLTNELATKAWEEFKQIEKNGGFIASVLIGNIKAKIEEQAFNLVNEYKEGKRTLIGVNKFPNSNDKPEKLAETPKNKGINKLSLTAALV